MVETINKLIRVSRQLLQELGREPTPEEIAEEMNLSVKSINRYKQKTMELLRNELKEYMPLLLLLFLRA